MSTGWKITLGAILAVALVTFLLMIMDYWVTVYNFLFGSNYCMVWANIILIIAIAAAVIAVIKRDSGSSSS